MDLEIESILSRLQNIFSADAYRYDLPDSYSVPAWYIPVPHITQQPDTTTTFSRRYTLPVGILRQNRSQAYETALNTANDLQRSRYLVKLRDENGNETGDFLRLQSVEVKADEKESGKVILKIGWSSRYAFDRKTYEWMGEMNVNSEVKS